MQPDLRVTSVEPSTSTATAGQPIGIDVTALNGGRATGEAPELTLSIYPAGGNPAESVEIGSRTLYGGLEHGEQRTARLEWTPLGVTG